MPTPEIIATELQNLTRETLSGVGVFDTLMRTTKLHLTEEYDAQRITGHEYATVYLGALIAVMQTSAQFLVSVQQSLLVQSQIDQIAASIINENARTANDTARTNNEVDRIAAEVLRINAEKTKIDADIINDAARTANDNTRTANETIKVAAEVDSLEANTLNTTNRIGQEILLMASQIANDTIRTENDTAKTDAEVASLESRTSNETLKTSAEIIAMESNTINTTHKVDAEVLLLGTQKANDTTRTNNDTTRANNETTKVEADVAAQAERTTAEVKLLNQKVATEVANVSDNIPVGLASNTNLTVEGITKAQKDLYIAQSTGFNRDAEQKLTKIMADVWSVQKSQDLGFDTDPDDPTYVPVFNSENMKDVLSLAVAGITPPSP